LSNPFVTNLPCYIILKAYNYYMQTVWNVISIWDPISEKKTVQNRTTLIRLFYGDGFVENKFLN